MLQWPHDIWIRDSTALPHYRTIAIPTRTGSQNNSPPWWLRTDTSIYINEVHHVHTWIRLFPQSLKEPAATDGGAVDLPRPHGSPLFTPHKDSEYICRDTRRHWWRSARTVQRIHFISACVSGKCTGQQEVSCRQLWDTSETRSSPCRTPHLPSKYWILWRLYARTVIVLR